MVINKIINGNDCQFKVEVISISVKDYRGWDGCDMEVGIQIESNGTSKDTKIIINYITDEVYNYCSNQDYQYLVNTFSSTGVTIEELENDFDDWFDRNYDIILANFFEYLIDFLWGDDYFTDDMVADALTNENSKYSYILNDFANSNL